ncbi:thioredoxin-like protein 1 [Diaphorina citri]|uniref:Thioredoxin-like protein 1 n=1 Tax=Diaphorina citri TaxID=121845 RepID=A0A1S3CYD2_DIACI|nr:thioredoxin-like protein 1 [Diaphorina citri]
MSIIVINSDAHFHTEMNNCGTKLVVVDFTASWCGPCQRIAPVFEQLSRKYPNAAFFKVDVDQNQDLAAAQGVSAMPTFIFFRNKVRGFHKIPDPNTLEAKIKQYYGVGEESGEESGVAGHMDLTSFIMKNQCEALNESDQHPFTNCLNTAETYLESDADEQLILSFTFNQSVKIHSLKIKAPKDKGPKTLKLFINQPKTLDFDAATSNQSVQQIELTEKDLDGTPINLRYVKFQNVQNLQIFVLDNQTEAETTVITHLALIGSPILTTKMSDFKRVAGEKGEAH